MRPQGTLALALIGLAVLPKTTSAAEFRSLAIARTFSVSDADLLPRSFEIWNDFPPCQEGIVERVDLYLIYAQSLDESPSAQASIEEVQEIFSKTSGWGGCISNVYGLGVNIDPSVDLYRLEEQSSNPLWVNGPNRQFERTIRALQGVTVGSCDLLYLMEIDSVPIQDFWLDTIVQEVHQDSKEFAILGSKYRGDKWDTFFDQLPWSLINHINGNAIYNLSHPVLELFVEQLEAEAPTVANSIPYDYRIAQIIEEVKSGQPPSFLWNGEESEKHQLPETFVAMALGYNLEELFRETFVIGNYASTNMVPDYFNHQEVVVHGANILVPWNSAKIGTIGLAISDWIPLGSQAIISTLESSNHPFEKAIVIAPEGIQAPLTEQSTIPVKFMSRMNISDSADLCTVQVDTTWFALSNAYHHLREDIQPMTLYHQGVYKAVVSFVRPDYESCYGYSTCARDIEIAQAISPGFDSVYQDFDFIFHTKSRDQYCDFLSSNTTWTDFPSATSYVAYLEKRGIMEELYIRADRNVVGSRRMFLPLDWSTPPTPTRRHLAANNDTTSYHSYACSAQRTKGECLSLPECSWRAEPHSCHARVSRATADQNVQQASSRPAWVGTISTILIVCVAVAVISLLVVGGRRFRERNRQQRDRTNSLVPLAGEVSSGSRPNLNGSEPGSGSLEEHSLGTIDLDPIRIIAERHFEETENGIEFLNND